MCISYNMLATKNNTDKVMEPPAATSNKSNNSSIASTSEFHSSTNTTIACPITSVAAAVNKVTANARRYTNNATVKKFTTTTLQKVRNKKKLLSLRNSNNNESESGGGAAAAASVYHYRRPVKPVANISRDLSECCTNSYTQISFGENSDSAKSSISTISSLDESSSSELSDIDLEIERIEKKIRMKESRLLPGMLHKTKREILAPVDPNRIYHPNWLKDEDAQKKDLYNLSRRNNLYFEKLGDPNCNQEEVSAWSEVDHPAKESSSLAKPSKPKFLYRYHDNTSLQINFRYFNDWRSHIIYYKQIKGYSHNQHLKNKLHHRLNGGNSNNKKPSDECNAANTNKSELRVVTDMKQTGLPYVESKTRLQPADTLENINLTLNQVSERNMEKSFQYANETQSGFFSKKSNGSFANINNQLNNITAQNQCAVQFAHKLNNLNSILSNTLHHQSITSVQNSLGTTTNQPLAAQATNAATAATKAFTSGSLNSSSFTGSNTNSYLLNPQTTLINTSNKTNNKLESYISSRKVKKSSLSSNKMDNNVQTLLDQIHHTSNLMQTAGSGAGSSGDTDRSTQVLPNVHRLKEKLDKTKKLQSIQAQHNNQFNGSNKNSSDNNPSNTSANNNRTLYNSTQKYVIEASKSGRHILSIQNETEYVVGTDTIKSKQTLVTSIDKSRGGDFYTRWSNLANHNSELNSIIKKNFMPDQSVSNASTITATPKNSTQQISNSIIKKKFSNLISLQSRIKHQQQETMNNIKRKHYSEADMVDTSLFGIQKSDSTARISKRKITQILAKSKEGKLITQSTGNLAGIQGTNSSSHFPRFIKDSHKVKITS